MSIPTSSPEPAAAPPEAAPPPLPSVDYEEFRRRLAGLADPSSSPGAITPAAIRQMAVRFVSILAHLYGDDLERVKLWDRIDSGIAAALAKGGSGDDVDRFASLCLEHVKADPGRAAACDPLLATLQTLGAAGAEDRNAFLAYFRDHRYPALAFARQRWGLVMNKEIDL